MTEPDFDALTARVLASPHGRQWMDELERRAGVPISFAVSDWKARIARMRERWRTGEADALLNFRVDDTRES